MISSIVAAVVVVVILKNQSLNIYKHSVCIYIFDFEFIYIRTYTCIIYRKNYIEKDRYMKK